LDSKLPIREMHVSALVTLITVEAASDSHLLSFDKNLVNGSEPGNRQARPDGFEGDKDA
jgi:hypothetical protein